MVGISGDILLWINHLHLMVSRIHPKINLRRPIIKNGDAEANGMVIDPERFSVTRNTLSFKSADVYTTFFFHQTSYHVGVVECVSFLVFLWRVFSFYYGNYLFFLPCLSSRFSFLFSLFICLFSSFQGIWQWCDYL
jgi:hypothetical protein